VRSASRASVSRDAAGDVEGAVRVAEELLAVGAGPEEDAGFDGGVRPAGVGLEAVVSSAERREVVVAGRTAAGVGDDVVAVAASGGARAPLEDAGVVPQAEPSTKPVGDS